MEVTVTETVLKATASSSFSLTPAIITWSFPAILPSDMKSLLSASPTWSSVKNVSSAMPHIPKSRPVTTRTSVSIDLTSFNLFPTHTVANSSSTASSTTVSSSAAYCKAPYANSTSHGGYNAPTLNVAREANSTETVTTIAPVATITGTGVAVESRVSFVALFLGVLVTALMF